MRQRHERHPFDFAITVGDNFQDYGPDSPVESRWKTYWEHLYPKLGIPFYATLGNHDWQAESGPAAEVLRTQIDPSWKMPASHYTFVSGPVQFFALNTNLISDRQLHWLAKSLRESQATWKIAYAHHPIFSSGSHGDTGELVKRLLPLIDGKVDAYFSGHDHHMEHLVSPLNQTQFFVCGTGGHSLRQPKPGTKTKFVACIYGWAEIEATSKQLIVRFVDEEKKALYEYRFAPLK